MRRVLVPLAALSLAFVAACGDKDSGSAEADADRAAGAPGATGAASVSEIDAQQREFENLVADCMKKQGFQYVPRPLETGNSDLGRFTGRSSMLESTEEVRKFRQKYGFGHYSRLVYPNDPAVTVQVMDPSTNPNNKIREGLDPARRKAYDLALEGAKADPKLTEDEAKKKKDLKAQGCHGEASVKVYGDGTEEEVSTKEAERAYRAFQTDPKVVAAAQKYADCLRGKGYKVDSARPGEVDEAMSMAAVDGKLPMDDSTGAKIPTGGAATAAVGGSAPVSPEVAKAALEVEIKAALADLDCRTDYATLVRTKHAKAMSDGIGVG
ncbi:hypothetical protein [Jidongwangia harbinensis]|uniref:hypothetical protein n=1 Tax=Jidongwangia harbinensis TaxID=2878561 RepID=UPI001CD96B0F|nr:hypothetical protein [Jidongwangia harbinensis]MCA2218650.1 hypothetical protein [Jidongwangia harbinensis]